MPIIIRVGQDSIFYLLCARTSGGATSTKQTLHTGIDWELKSVADVDVSGSILGGLTRNWAVIAPGKINGADGWVLGSGNTSADTKRIFSSTAKIPSATTFDLSSPDFEPTQAIYIAHYSATNNKWIIGGNNGMFSLSPNGTSWTEYQGGDRFTTAHLRSIDEGNGGEWLVTAVDGVWKTTDGGANWSQSLALTASAGGINHAAGTWLTGGNNTIYRSTNSGASWSAGARLSGSNPTPPVGDGSGTWAYTFVASQRWRISYSTDDGLTWDHYNLDINSADTDASLAYHEGKWFWISKQAGVYRWNNITTNTKTQLFDSSDFNLGPSVGGTIQTFGAVRR